LQVPDEKTLEHKNKAILLGEGFFPMLKELLFLMGVMCAFSVSAIPNHELIKNLRDRIIDLPKGQGSLIKSFTDHSQSYIYDQALAVIALTKANDQINAQRLLKGLSHLQLKDGSLYFSYYLDGKSPYPKEGDKRFAGAIAWVALAATHYQKKFHQKEFVVFNSKILHYMNKEMLPIEVKGSTTRALRFAPSDIKETPWSEADTAALEHNLDAYAAFYHFGKINKSSKWNNNVEELRKFILAMWDKSDSHFWSGASIKLGRINKSELYLDNQTWSLLALHDSDLKEIKPHDALELNCETFLVNHEGVTGFMDSKPTRRPASSKFVWSEGSLGQILAMKKVNKTCDKKTSDDFLNSVKKMKKIDGGIAYATTTINPDFTTSSSVAGTAWMYFAINNINPFEVDS
jgi:hypothetical protein